MCKPTLTDQERIASAKIIYVLAVSGCGKSFTGDYLELMHGYKHVDGDGPLKACYLPKNYELTKGFLSAFPYVMEKDQDGPEEMWKPYFDEIAKLTLDAAKSSEKVVLTHATYRQAWREHVVTKLIEGGVKEENISVLWLTIDPDVKLKGLYYRTKEQVENAGMTMGDAQRAGGWEGEGDMTLEEFLAFTKEKYPEMAGNGLFEDAPVPEFATKVDVSGRDMSHLDNVDDALGFDIGQRNLEYSNLSFEELRDKIKVADQKRDVEFAKTGSMEMVNKLSKEIFDGNSDSKETFEEVDTSDVTDKEELEKIEKRRSSLSAVEYLEREYSGGRSIRSSLASSDDNNGEKEKMMNTRRSSLIKTGKIDIEGLTFDV